MAKGWEPPQRVLPLPRLPSPYRLFKNSFEKPWLPVGLGIKDALPRFLSLHTQINYQFVSLSKRYPYLRGYRIISRSLKGLSSNMPGNLNLRSVEFCATFSRGILFRWGEELFKWQRG